MYRSVYSTADHVELTLIVIENNIAEHFAVSEQLLRHYAPHFYATLTNGNTTKNLLHAGRQHISDFDHETLRISRNG
jgi:hypothetical protein